jgi:VanZ family protein
MFVVFAALTLLWAGVIFVLSAQNGAESSGLSGSISESLIGSFIHGEGFDAALFRERVVYIFNMVLRKIAHAGIYFILGALSYIAASNTRAKKTAPFASYLFCVLYASSDELHQYFVPGRSCMFYDVIIDALGAAAGIFIVYIILKHADKRKRAKKTAAGV